MTDGLIDNRGRNLARLTYTLVLGLFLAFARFIISYIMYFTVICFLVLFRRRLFFFRVLFRCMTFS